MNKNKLKKLLVSLTILSFCYCTISARNPLDSSQPLGAIYQLIPIFFPGLRPSSAKEMKTYFIARTGSSAIITGTKMSLIVPYSTNLNSLSAEFYHTGKSSKVNGIEQISGQTVNSHSQTLVYTITAANATQKSYTLSTAKGSPDSNTLFGFQFDSFNSRGVIVGTNVTVYLPFETNLNNLTPTFSHDGMKALVGGIEQISNRTSSNFSSPVLFDVQAFNGTTRQYTISTSVGSSNSKEIKSFILNSSAGSISGTNIFISIPFGTTVTNLAAAFAHTGKKVLVNGVEQANGVTENNFTTPLKYTVVAADDSRQDYNVIVSFGNPNQNTNTNSGIGGTVGGLVSGRTLVLQNNLSDNLTITANGSFSFATIPSSGISYNVTVLNQPQGQFCQVTNGSGIFSNTVTNILVDCNATPGNEVQSFTDNGDGTIKDNNTGLIWMKCAMSDVSGVPRSGTNCLGGTIGTYQFCNTNNHNCNGGSSSINLQPPPWIGGSTSSLWTTCNQANATPAGGFAGKTNWRVPTSVELMSITDYNTYSPAINGVFFPNTLFSSPYWSSITNVLSPGTALHVGFDIGLTNVNGKASSYYVRCVSNP